jgi:hypothetical protein
VFESGDSRPTANKEDTDWRDSKDV